MAKLFYKSKDGLADLTGNGGDTSKVVGQKYYGTDGEIKGEVFNTYGENGSIASGFNSHAEGRSFALGDYSHAEGYSDILNNASEVEQCEIHKMTSELKEVLGLTNDYSYIIYDYRIDPLKSILKSHSSSPIPVTSYEATTYDFSISGDYFNIAETSIPLGEATYKFVYDSNGEEEECDVDIREVDENERLLFKYLEIDELPRYVDANDSLPDGELGKLYNTETNELVATITTANYFTEMDYTVFEINQQINEGLYYVIKADNVTIQESGAHVGHSHVEGYRSTAMASAAHVEGEYTLVSGRGAHAEGYKTQASDSYAHAEGKQTWARATYSHAEGRETVASGRGSHAEGQNTIASGHYSHAEGGYDGNANIRYVTASGYSSHAEGDGTSAKGSCSHAENRRTIASGDYSHAEGNGSQASGAESHAEGGETRASGVASHAEGSNTKAQSLSSHAEGISTVATSNGSHSEGLYSEAVGVGSHAEGWSTSASGKYSHAEGGACRALGEYQHVQGKYNIVDSNNKYAMIIGNGENGDKRSNAFTVDWNGFVECAGFILTSPNGTQYKVTISDDGIFTTTKVE